MLLVHILIVTLFAICLQCCYVVHVMTMSIDCAMIVILECCCSILFVALLIPFSYEDKRLAQR